MVLFPLNYILLNDLHMVMRNTKTILPLYIKSETYRETIILHMSGKTIGIKTLLPSDTFRN